MPFRVEIPSLQNLIFEWDICKKCNPLELCHDCEDKPRTFRLLAEWVRTGKLKKGWIDKLPNPLVKCYRNPWKEVPEFPTDARLLIPPPESENSFTEWLILAWCVRQADHFEALAHPRLKQRLKEMENLGMNREQLLSLTYVPRPIFGMVPKLRAGMKDVRDSEVHRAAINSHKQKVAKNLPSRFTGEQVLNRDQEEIWAARWGFDKATASDSKQKLWTLVFVPLTTYLHQYVSGRKVDSWKTDTLPVPDIVFEHASTLIHYRYPDLWSNHQWQRVKARCLKYIGS